MHHQISQSEPRKVTPIFLIKFAEYCSMCVQFKDPSARKGQLNQISGELKMKILNVHQAAMCHEPLY